MWISSVFGHTNLSVSHLYFHLLLFHLYFLSTKGSVYQLFTDVRLQLHKWPVAQLHAPMFFLIIIRIFEQVCDHGGFPWVCVTTCLPLDGSVAPTHPTIILYTC